MSFLDKWALPIGRHLARRAGYEISPAIPADFTLDEREIYQSIHAFTMTGPYRIQSLVNAVTYIDRCGISGDIVECGVWRGGSMMAAALTMIKLGSLTRDLYLFDTFEGMPEPGPNDTDPSGSGPIEGLANITSDYYAVSVEQVRKNLHITGYPSERVRLIQGPVESTIPERAPERIALLRLDTDWYESTRHELVHLFPLLTVGGVLIIDDYGHFPGARRAVDEYLAAEDVPILLNRIDYTGRIGVKIA